MKKPILIVLVLLGFALAPHVLADTTQGFTALAPITGLTDQAPTTGGLATFFNNLYKYLIGVAAIFAVIEIIWGGLEISTQDSVSKQSAGRERIQEAILGLVLVLSPVLVFSIINPSILNLSLNLPAIKGAAPAPYSGNGNESVGTPSAPDANGCSTNGTSYLMTITCSDRVSAQRYSCPIHWTESDVYDCSKDSAGNCVDKAKKYCMNQLSIGWYAYKAGFFSSPTNKTILSSDKDKANSFSSGCQSELGTVSLSQVTNDVDCPPTPNDIPPAPSGSSIVCYTQALTCVNK